MYKDYALFAIKGKAKKKKKKTETVWYWHEKKTHRWMEQNEETRNKPTDTWIINLWWKTKNTQWTTDFSTNGSEKTGQPQAKE